MLNRYNFISIFGLSLTGLEKNDCYSIQLLSRIIILYIYKMEEQVIFILFSYKKRDKFEHSFLQMKGIQMIYLSLVNIYE